MTLGDEAVSRGVKSRPARIGVPYVANHPGVISLTQTSRSDLGSDCPGKFSICVSQLLLVDGRDHRDGGAATPGTVDDRLSNPARTASGWSAGGHAAAAPADARHQHGRRIEAEAHVAPDVQKDCRNSPPPTTSTSDSATCPTTSRLPKPNRFSPTIDRPCALIASCGSTRVPRRAGTVPKISAVVIATAAVNAEHTPVQREVQDDGLGLGRELPDQQAATPLCEEQAEQRAGHRQQQALGDELTRDPRSATRPAQDARSARDDVRWPSQAAGSRCWRTRSTGPSRRPP